MNQPGWAEPLLMALHTAMAYTEAEHTKKWMDHWWEHYRYEPRERSLRYIELGYTRQDVEAKIAAAHAAGWTGSDAELWKTAETMSHLSGAMPWHPQRAFMERQLARQRWAPHQEGASDNE